MANNHTYTLVLRPDPQNSAVSHVDIQEGKMFWNGVQQGDMVRFVPDPGLSDATVKVNFVSTDGSGKLPVNVNPIQSSSFNQVTDPTQAFTTMCFLTVNGVTHGYPADGKRPCDGEPC